MIRRRRRRLQGFGHLIGELMIERCLQFLLRDAERDGIGRMALEEEFADFRQARQQRGIGRIVLGASHGGGDGGDQFVVRIGLAAV